MAEIVKRATVWLLQIRKYRYQPVYKRFEKMSLAETLKKLISLWSQKGVK